MPHNVATPTQARAQDTLRWGSTVTPHWDASPSGTTLAAALRNAKAQQGSQLVNAHWHYPLSWRVVLVLTARFSEGETGDLDVVYSLTIGSGDGQCTVTRKLSLAPDPNGFYFSAIDNALALPACDLLIEPLGINTSDGAPISLAGAVEIGAFVAPETEPHVMAHMLELMKTGQGEARDGGWMCADPFSPERLGYGR